MVTRSTPRGLAERLVATSRALSAAVSALSFRAPVTHVYDPLAYARGPHEAYLRRYGDSPKEALLLGMNPGPFGMVQTGVPFGDVASVRDWLRIEGPVGRPPVEHPKRPVLGFACPRNEVSGSRLWGWAKDHAGSPERFFSRFFVWNYCPLAFLEETGRNRTPDKLPADEREALFAACDEALVHVVSALSPSWVIGVGAFAHARARAACGATSGVRHGSILHPSPASPKANRGWAAAVDEELRALGVAAPG